MTQLHLHHCLHRAHKRTSDETVRQQNVDPNPDVASRWSQSVSTLTAIALSRFPHEFAAVPSCMQQQIILLTPCTSTDKQLFDRGWHGPDRDSYSRRLHIARCCIRHVTTRRRCGCQSHTFEQHVFRTFFLLFTVF